MDARDRVLRAVLRLLDLEPDGTAAALGTRAADLDWHGSVDRHDELGADDARGEPGLRLARVAPGILHPPREVRVARRSESLRGRRCQRRMRTLAATATNSLFLLQLTR